MNILLVEDDTFLQEGLEVLLQKEGYALRTAGTVREAERLLSADTNLIILDVGLPDGSGFDFCARVRRSNPSVPILFLTARDEEYDVVRGFELGGNDYITKPFRSLEFLARVRAQLRRDGAADVTRHDRLTLNHARYQAVIEDKLIQLTPTEFSLLHKLVANQGQILGREQLLASLWDLDGQYIDDNTLSVHIFRLREKIGHAAIETVRGSGYCWRGLAP